MPLEALYEPEPSLESPATKRRFRTSSRSAAWHAHLTAIAARPATEAELERIHTARLHRIDPRALGPERRRGGGGHAVRPRQLRDRESGGRRLHRRRGRGARRDGRKRVRAGAPARAITPNRIAGVATASLPTRPSPPATPRPPAGSSGSRSWTGTSTTATAARAAFYDDPSVLTISLRQEEHYPAGRGRVTDAGEGAGLGFNLNIPLPAGTGRAGYELAFEQVVLPALDAFKPQLILVASGLDANWCDPGGRMNLMPECFGRLTRMLMEAADRLCGGRLVLLHEGGYSTLAVPYCGLAVLEALTGHSAGVPPTAKRATAIPPRATRCASDERAAVDAAAANL